MKTNIQLIGFDGFKHHKDYIKDRAMATIGKFEKNKEFSANVICRKVSSKYSPEKNLFECDLQFFGDYGRKDLFFKKHGADFKGAVTGVLMAAEKSLRRESQTRTTRRRKLHKNAQSDAVI